MGLQFKMRFHFNQIQMETRQCKVPHSAQSTDIFCEVWNGLALLFVDGICSECHTEIARIRAVRERMTDGKSQFLLALWAAHRFAGDEVPLLLRADATHSSA